MRKIVILLGALCLQQAYAQQEGKVGINTETPSEILDVKGTAKVQELPESGAGKIYNGTNAKATTFTGTRTLVSDDNGVLGYVEGLPNTGEYHNIYDSNGTLTSDRTVNTNGKKLMFAGTGRISMGNTNPQYRLDITGIGNEYNDNSIALRSFRNNSGSHGLDFYRAFGSQTNPSAVQANILSGGINFIPYSGTKYISTVSIYTAVDTGISTDRIPTSLNIETNPTGTTTDHAPSYTTLFHHSGNVAIGKSSKSTAPVEKLEVEGAIRIKSGSYTGITDNATTPVPAGGAGTMVFQDGHFFGWTGKAWKQLDN